MTRANAGRKRRRLKRRRELPYALAWVLRRLRELYRAGRIIGGPAAHLYTTLATYYVRPQRCETDDIVVRELTEATHMHPSTLRRALHTLEDELGDVKLTDGGQGAPTWRVTFVRMGGPVLMAAFSDPEPPGAPGASTPRAERAKFEDQDFAQSARSSDKPRGERAKFEDDDYSSDVLEEEDSSSNDVAVYLAWYAHEYPQWHFGAAVPRISEQRRAYVEELLERMPLRRLQLMTLVMFVIPREARGTGPRRPGESENDRMFIARPDNDHSLTVLYTKSPFLAGEVTERKLEGSDQSLDAIADALRHQVQDADRAASSAQPFHDVHWPTVCARLPQLQLTEEEIRLVALWRLERMDDNDRVVWVLIPTWQHADEAHNRKPVAARFESVEEAFEAAVKGELKVERVRYRCANPQSGDVREAQVGGAAC